MDRSHPSAFARRAGPLLLLLLVAGAAPPDGARASRRSAAEPRPAPGFTLPTRDGTVSLEGLRGKVVLVDFWASWCAPCRQSFPWLREMGSRYGAQGLEVVAIDLDKDRRLADAFLIELAPTFTVAFDPQGKTAEAFGVEAMPSSFLVGRDGRLLVSHPGFDSKDTGAFERRIREEVAK